MIAGEKVLDLRDRGMVNVLLVGGACNFGVVLAKKLRAVGAKVYILDTDEAEVDDVEFILGKPQNTVLARRVVNECKIARVFLIPKPDDGSTYIGTLTSDVLLGAAALVEELRVIRTPTSTHPQIIHIGQISPVPGNMTAHKAAILSVEAFLHSYAVSYRMDVRLIRMVENVDPNEYERLAREVVEISSSTSKEPAKIYELEAKVSEKPVEQISQPSVLILIYGANGFVGTQFTEILKQNDVPYVVGVERPGSVSDNAIRDEIARVAPSHIVCMVGRTHGPGCGNIDYLEGGPDKLTENVRDNLFAPWCLANICEELKIHFTYLGTGCLYNYAKSGLPHSENDLPTFIGNNYSVAKGFTDRLLQPFAYTLNVRIRLPFNDENSPRNLLKKLTTFNKILDVENSITYLPDLLPTLLSLIIEKHVGTVNLVSPGAISFKRMVEIYSEETGTQLNYETVNVDDNPNATKNRAHCILDTSLLQILQPNVLNVEEAVRRASRKIAQNVN